jgi:hypothetical protein
MNFHVAYPFLPIQHKLNHSKILTLINIIFSGIDNRDGLPTGGFQSVQDMK